MENQANFLPSYFESIKMAATPTAKPFQIFIVFI